MQRRFVLYSLASMSLLAQCKPTSENKNVMQEDNKPAVLLHNPNLITVVYPPCKKSDVEETFFGQTIADPYRWLEGGNPADSNDLSNWIEAESKIADNYLKAIPLRAPIEERLRELWNYERFGTPIKEGNSYYYFKNDGMQNQAVLYKTASLADKGSVFLDPNTLSEDGTVALMDYAFSNDARYMAYAVSSGGSDWQTIHVRDVATGKDLSDKIEWVRYSAISWYKDGFFYSAYPNAAKQGDKYTQKNEFQQVLYHKVGTPASSDQLVFADHSQPQNSFTTVTSEDERFLLIYASQTTSGNAVYYKRLDVPNAEIEVLIPDFKHDFAFIDNEGDRLWFHTNYNAPNWQLLEIDLKNPAPAKWKPIIKTDAKRVLESVTLSGNTLATSYIHNASNRLELYDRAGKLLQKIALPDSIAKINNIAGKKTDRNFFYSVSSFTRPTTILQFSLDTKQRSVWKASKVKDFEPDDYITKQVFFPSADGTLVPMFIVHDKTLQLNGNNPTLMYGYGGFNISLLPKFDVSNIPLLEERGVYVMVNLRGGGEFGQKWYDGGRLFNKQNVFNDFIAAAEFLINNKYTSRSKLGIEGGSNGGLLVGACMTQRPELFQVAIPRVGVLDMLRYHKFTIGAMWANDYGTSEDSLQFKNLLKYSPLHNVRPTDYPATLVMTGEFDDRVVPAHSFKFGAALQANQTSKRPILLRIDRKSGHGAGKPTDKLIEEAADKLSFLMFHLDIK